MTNKTITSTLSWSNLAAQFSEQIALAAAPLVAVLLLNAGAGMTGLLQTAQTLPFLLLSIPAGVLADRISRRQLMIWSELLRALALAFIFMALFFEILNFTLLAAFGFLVATGTVVYSVATPALVQNVVPREMLVVVNRRLELVRSIAFTAGPALGGALVGWAGASSAYILATVLSIFAALLLVSMSENPRPVQAKKNLLAELNEGATFLFAHPLLRPILITAVIFNLAWFILQAIYVLYVTRTMNMSAVEVGLTLSTYGVGMVLGAIAAKWLNDYLSVGVMIFLGPLCALIAAIIMFITVFTPLKALVYVSFFLFGVGPIIWTITTTTLRQTVTPGYIMGRVSAVIMTATFGARPIGAAIGALVGERFGLEICLMLVVIGFMLQFLVIIFSPVVKLKVLPLT